MAPIKGWHAKRAGSSTSSSCEWVDFNTDCVLICDTFLRNDTILGYFPVSADIVQRLSIIVISKPTKKID